MKETLTDHISGEEEMGRRGRLGEVGEQGSELFLGAGTANDGVAMLGELNGEGTAKSFAYACYEHRLGRDPSGLHHSSSRTLHHFATPQSPDVLYGRDFCYPMSRVRVGQKTRLGSTRAQQDSSRRMNS